MDVLLVKEVGRLGKPGQAVSVKKGYARNFLFPQGLAVPANTGARGRMDALRAADLRQIQALKLKAVDLAHRLKDLSCRVAVKMGAQGKLHGAVTSKDIAEALQRQGITLEKRRIVMEGPITKLGMFRVPVKLHQNVNGMVQVEVVQGD